MHIPIKYFHKYDPEIFIVTYSRKQKLKDGGGGECNVKSNMDLSNIRHFDCRKCL